jgi:hypothetical protein
MKQSSSSEESDLMALYVPASRRRRRTILFTVGALVVGLIIGAAVGRTSAPSLTGQVHSVQEKARQTASGLRVLSLHEQAGVASNGTSGDGGADLVLSRTRDELQSEFADAPWLDATSRKQLLDQVDALDAQDDPSSPKFASAADALATQVEATFGVRP